ncbi:MAG: UDP-4-amino-4,6-dideoxy-N-acetyl-beta-L-altrosamine transaminase [Prolixibacteraceae bacterium]|nr:UDP-4-amino-4,6-dideoxy-N-acetyl-beta-L-altrosamine transaminase [Prolixibacteraceae bacterium]MBN2773194.1 UDP-4-amino-4,6-dideoxy-N-acetyl-beta-L-altrosamine transaminase [Prolixibacteraceae bacterium]
MHRIPYGKQNITEEDIQTVVDVLRSDYLTQGPKIAEFEAAFAKYIGCKYAVAVSHGTAALHMAALSAGIQPGDKVITTPVTFVATANCIRFCDGEVIFSDIDPQTYILDIDKVRKLLKNSPAGTYKAIILVDFAGYPMDMEAFRDLADEFGLKIIEDAAHAPGGWFNDRSGIKQNCGNGRFADLAIFSFHPIKHIATGEGGMITTNDEKLYQCLRNLRTHGIQQIPEKEQFNHNVWYYEMQELGYNYRLTDIQAALGISQLNRAKKGLEKRKEIISVYKEAFSGAKFIIRQPGNIPGHAYHLYVVEVENRDGLIKHLRNKSIMAQVHYIPVHLMPYYQNLGWKKGDFPVAENYYKHCLSLPVYPTLTEKEQAYVIKNVKEFYE